MALGIARRADFYRAVCSRGKTRHGTITRFRFASLAATISRDGGPVSSCIAFRFAIARLDFRNRRAGSAAVGLHIPERAAQGARSTHRGGHIAQYALK